MRPLTAGAAFVVAIAACGGGTPAPKYAVRPAGCPVKTFPAEARGPVDELGPVVVDCAPGAPGATTCERQVLDAVCARGGDVAWGMGSNALTATHIEAHAAHTKRATGGPSERGCPVQAFDDAPPFPTENIGPVAAKCSADDSRDVCLRELKDQVCLMGGDVVWQTSGPLPDGNKQRMQGRAAHTR